MAHLTDADVRALVGQVFGRAAAETLAYRPGAPMEAARPTNEELNTYERTLKTVIGQTMGRRAAAIFALAEIMTIPETRHHDGKVGANTWEQPIPGQYYSGTFVQVKKWTKAEREQIRKPLPKR